MKPLAAILLAIFTGITGCFVGYQSHPAATVEVPGPTQIVYQDRDVPGPERVETKTVSDPKDSAEISRLTSELSALQAKRASDYAAWEKAALDALAHQRKASECSQPVTVQPATVQRTEPAVYQRRVILRGRFR